MSGKRNAALELHPLVHIFPPMTGEERAGTKASIKESGVIMPVITWTDAEEKTWIIDGRNRWEIVNELKAEGVKEAANGVPMDCAFYEYRGTERMALEYVLRMNRDRRNITSQQRAAISVKAGELAARYEAREGGTPDARPEADRAELLALNAGTNRSFLFECQKLLKDAPDLLDRVITGDAGLKACDTILKRRRLGLPDEPTAGEDAEDAPPPAPPKPPPEVKDGEGRAVSVDHGPLFAVRDEVKRILKAFKMLVAEVDILCDADGGQHIPKQEITAEIVNAAKLLAASQPHKVCPYCKGDGKIDKKKCGQCKGLKWMDKLQWKLVPDALKGRPAGESDAPEE